MNSKALTEDDRKRILEIVEIVQEANAMEVASLRKAIDETAHRTRSIHRILVGEPEIKRKGLVEIVDRHEMLVTRGGAAFCTIYAGWEVYKAAFLNVH